MNMNVRSVVQRVIRPLPPEVLLYKTCVDKNCDGDVELSKLGREMRYGKEETDQILDKE